jgi:hypothetical protein
MSVPVRLPWHAHLLRAIGVAIVVAGVIDPSFTRERTARPTIAVVSADSLANRELLTAVRARLAVAAIVTGVEAVEDVARVIVGDAIVGDVMVDGRAVVPTFVVSPHVIRVGALDLPTHVSLPTRVQVQAVLARDGGAGAGAGAGVVTVQLRQHAVVLAEDSVRLDNGVPRTVSLTWVPARGGVQALEFRVHDRVSGDSTRLARAVVVDSARWRVLSYDARPSYLSTFVRRALARDPRFAVSTRIVTASTAQQRVSLGSARAPESLASLDATGADVILVGAPEALSARDVEALRRAMREQGVSVVLLADRAAPGPIDALVASGGWRTSVRREPARVRAATPPADAADRVALRGLALGTPVRLPADAEPVLVMDDASQATVVWRQPVGAGELLVSGAFDGWRYRDAGQSTFDATWRDLVAASAARRAPRLVARPDHLELVPGERATVVVTTAGGRARPAVAIARDGGAPTAFGVHPTAVPHEWIGVGYAPSDAGSHRVRITVGGDTLVVPMWVAGEPARGAADPFQLVRAWARARGGDVIPASDLGGLAARVLAARQPRPRSLPWHPMRNPWWIIPLTLALAGDWWLRRRRGWP